jgi:hypothetical protein
LIPIRRDMINERKVFKEEYGKRMKKSDVGKRKR